MSVWDALPWRIGDKVERSLAPTEIDNSVMVEECGANGPKLVVILGWGGARQKHLSRIRQFYSRIGYDVISYISPMSCFLHGHLIEKDIVELAETIERKTISRNSSPKVARRFHIHLHSNNGTTVLGGLIVALKKTAPEVLDALTAIVFDSAPRVPEKPPGVVFMVLGFTFPCVPIILQRNTYVHWVWTPALFFYFLLKLLWRRSAHASHRFSMVGLRPIISNGLPMVPQLYVYSAADKLITARNVEAYMARQRDRGVQIHAKKFADTPHVQHFLRRETEYAEALTSFLGPDG